jgi:hypothetical protein
MIKEDMNKCLNKLQEITNKQLNETRKIIQDMKKEFNEDKYSPKLC